MFTPPLNNHPIYITAETYSFNIIPRDRCISGNGYAPILRLILLDDDDSELEKYEYIDYSHNPIMLDSNNYNSGDPLHIIVNYAWLESPYHDFTVKVYSPYSGMELVDKNGNTNMLYTDGTTEPSEFAYAATINPYLPTGWETDPKTTRVDSMTDAFYTSDTSGHFWNYVWYQPWILLVWFDYS